MPLGSYPQPTRVVQHLYDRATAWILRPHPLKDLPLNIRPGMIFVTAAWLILLGILGMAPLPELPVNDKALHFVGMGFASFLIYFTIDVPEGTARRIWYIRKAPLLLSGTFGFILGGIISEIVQSFLPWKEFQWGDILANLLGASLFIYLAHLLHLRLRKRQELSSLYQPLSAQNAHTYRDAQGRQHAFDVGSPTAAGGNGREGDTARNGSSRHVRQGSNVWEESSEARTSVDERDRGETMFELGDDDDEEPRREIRREPDQLV